MKLFALPAALLLSSAVAFPVAEPEAAAATTVKIMPFGASIVGAPGCWRARLWKKLQDANIKNTDFVGSNAAPDCGTEFAGYDGENEGHAGVLAREIVDKNQLPGYLAAANPDVMVMHLGTNDCIQRKTTEDTIGAYFTLIDQMRAFKPKMKIIVSKLIPIDDAKFPGAQKYIDALNKKFDETLPQRSTADSPITIVDNASGFVVANDTRDGEHPNASGDEKLATKFYPAVAAAIKSVSP